MALVALKKLIALQKARFREIEAMKTRLNVQAAVNLTRPVIKARIEDINNLWKETRDSHLQIITHDKIEQETGFTEQEFHNARVVNDEIKDQLLNLLGGLPRDDTSNTSSEIPNNSRVDLAYSQIAHMPKIELPKFSGKYEDWESFSDLFSSLIQSQPGLTDATKLQYLKSCLVGPAAELVRDVTVTHANYSSTWTALKNRFDNPRLIVQNHLNSLFALPHLRKESAEELRIFSDEVQRIVRALTNLKLPVQHWDVLLTHIIAARLDGVSRRAWELQLCEKDRKFVINGSDNESLPDPSSRFPAYVEIIEFLEKRVQTLKMMILESKPDLKIESNTNKGQRSRNVLVQQRLANFNPSCCPSCKGAHFLYHCTAFRDKTVYNRRNEIRSLKLCFNCFGTHKHDACTSKGRCHVCKEKHHSLLHFDTRRPGHEGQNKPSNEQKRQNGKGLGQNHVNVHTSLNFSSVSPVVLATAQLKIRSADGKDYRARALLDQGSESTFITTYLADLLCLPTRPTNLSLHGLGGIKTGYEKKMTTITLLSIVDANFKIEIPALIHTRLTTQLPTNSIVNLNLEQFSNLKLADPEFHRRGPIDIILGADVYGRLLLPGLQFFPSSNLCGQQTVLGWIISGALPNKSSRRVASKDNTSLGVHHCISNDELSLSLMQFWQLEEIPEFNDTLSPDEKFCEDLFMNTHRRNADGRYCVRLPLEEGLPDRMMETKGAALGSLAQIHRKLSQDERLHDEYCKFMREYEELGHMSKVLSDKIDSPGVWYIPYHAVVTSKLDKWKLRVVFNASRKTRDGVSLNEFLLPGPALQRDLSMVLLEWRLHRYVFTADIIKMFRQIDVDSADQDLQRIVWAPPKMSPIHYKLSTVTYGTTSAPYLAIRTLLQLAKDEKSRYPLGAEILEQHTYVDDIFVGADDIPTIIHKRDELKKILNTAGIQLSKWAANHSHILFSKDLSCTDDLTKEFQECDDIKTLGIIWSPQEDKFRFCGTKREGDIQTITKRTMSSQISCIFDPLGWLAPITVTAKILLQDSWILKCDWDCPLPADFRERWNSYSSSLKQLPQLSMNRWTGAVPGQDCEIHGFCDASSRAYAAVLYLRIDKGNRVYHTSLLAARTKIAPVKTISIPNLELCGAVLLTKLLVHIQKIKSLQMKPVHLWTDSQIVLNWLSKHPRSWKTFVANRISFIQTQLPTAVWSHVPTKQNPADLASRGVTPSQLATNSIWLYGPNWLTLPNTKWPSTTQTIRINHTKTKNSDSLTLLQLLQPLRKESRYIHTIQSVAEPQGQLNQAVSNLKTTSSKLTSPADLDILNRFSTLTRLIRVTATCRRPLLQARRRLAHLPALPSIITLTELREARYIIIKLAQLASFPKELELLKAGKSLPKHHPLLKLNVFVDSNSGILRVGGD